MKKSVFTLILGILVPILSFGQRVPADLILFNGKVFTANPAHPYAQAIAIRDEHIIAVGFCGRSSLDGQGVIGAQRPTPSSLRGR